MPKIQISELVDKVSSSIKASELLEEGKYPVYGAQGVVGFLNTYQTSIESIAIIKDGAGVGRVQITKPFSSVIGTIQLLVPKNKIDVKYLYYLFTSLKLGSSFSGATIPHIYFKDYGKAYINCHSYNEQICVSKSLSTIEEIINKSKQEIAFLDDLIKSRFNEMFSKCKADTKLGDVSNICRGASPRPISSFITKDINGINWIKIGDVENDAIYITKTEERITRAGANKSREVHIGDFILSNSMSFGRPYILGINGCVHDGWLIISNYQHIFEPLFLYYSLRSDDVQNQFIHEASGTTVKNLNSDIVKNIFVIKPPLKEQKEFSSFVNQIDKLKFNVQKRIEYYQELLNKKMDEYFN